MRQATIRQFGGRAAEVAEVVYFCASRYDAQKMIVAAVIVAIDEEYDAPVLCDLHSPSGNRFLCSPPDERTSPVVYQLGGQFFDGEHLADMAIGQWTWKRAVESALTEAADETRPDGQRHQKRRR